MKSSTSFMEHTFLEQKPYGILERTWDLALEGLGLNLGPSLGYLCNVGQIS